MSQIIHLDTKLDIFNLSENEALLESVLASSELVINTAKVEHCDYMGIQMLVSFIKTFANQDRSLSFEAPSNNFLNAITILGLVDEFNFMDKDHG